MRQTDFWMLKKQFQFFCWFHYVWDSAAAAFLLSLRGMKYLRPQKHPKLWNIFWAQKQPKLPNGNKDSWSRNYICITFDFIAIFNKKHSHNRGGRLTSFMRCLVFFKYCQKHQGQYFFKTSLKHRIVRQKVRCFTRCF